MQVGGLYADIIGGRLEECRAAILASMEAAGVNASRRTANSLQVLTGDGSVRLAFIGGVDRAPAATLEVGRPGGNVPKGFYNILAQWSKDKGIQFATERERNTFAYFLAKRIAAEGTLRHANNIDIYSTNAREAVADIRSRLKAAIVTQLNTNL